MERREFIALLGMAAAAMPSPAAKRRVCPIRCEPAGRLLELCLAVI